MCWVQRAIICGWFMSAGFVEEGPSQGITPLSHPLIVPPLHSKQRHEQAYLYETAHGNSKEAAIRTELGRCHRALERKVVEQGPLPCIDEQRLAILVDGDEQ